MAFIPSPSYSRRNWKDGSSGGTPITAAYLNNMEAGIADAATAAQATAAEAAYEHYEGRALSQLLAPEIGSGALYDALHKRISAGNYSGLRVGDYMDVPLTATAGVTSQTSVRARIAHFDPYYQCGDSPKPRHIAFVVDCIAVASDAVGVANGSYLMWNTANTNQGTADEKHPYLASNQKKWEKLLEGCMPAELMKYVLTQRVLLEERYSASGSLDDSNSWSWADIGKLWSLSEIEVYGQCVWGTKGYSVGFDCQFDYFRDTWHRLPGGSRIGWWLRSVRGGSSSNVCDVNNHGRADCYAATNDWIRPRVGFLLG